MTLEQTIVGFDALPHSASACSICLMPCLQHLSTDSHLPDDIFLSSLPTSASISNYSLRPSSFSGHNGKENKLGSLAPWEKVSELLLLVFYWEQVFH